MFQSVWDSLSAGRQRFGQPASERSSALDTGSIALGLQGDVSLPVLAAHASPPIRGWSATTDLLTGPLSAAGPAADAGRLGERPGHLGHHGRTPGAPTYVQDRPANAARAIARTWGAAPRLVIPVGTLAARLVVPDAGRLVTPWAGSSAPSRSLASGSTPRRHDIALGPLPQGHHAGKLALRSNLRGCTCVAKIHVA